MARLDHLAGVAYEGLDALSIHATPGPPGQIHRRQAAPGRHDARRHRAPCRGLRSKLEADRDARDFEELAAMGITPGR
jgi:hypothetical protein